MAESNRQIREGAGLEESRLNTEFIAWLQTYGFWLLMLVAIAAVGFKGWTWYENKVEKGTDEAWAKYEAAGQSRNPTTLEREADESSVRAMAALARITSADLRMDSFRTGVPAGTQLEPGGVFPKDVTPLTDAQRQEELAKAAALYQRVFDDTKDDEGQIHTTIAALAGLQSVDESKGDFEAARAKLQQIIDRANAAGFPERAKAAEKARETLDTLKNAPKLYAEADLPKEAAALQPTTTPMQNMTFKTADGKTMMVGPDGKITEVTGQTPAPAPVPGAITPPAGGAVPTIPPAPAPAPTTPTPTTPAPTTPAPANTPPATPTPAPAPTEPAKPQ